MREIKFRAWREGKMIYGTDDLYSLVNALKLMDMPNTMEWMQYTGLKDKNGKEIYEGDVIVQVATQHGTGKRLEFKKQVVEMKPFYFADYEDCCAGSGFIIETCSLEEIEKEWEVIGNLYENPYLIPQNK